MTRPTLLLILLSSCTIQEGLPKETTGNCTEIGLRFVDADGDGFGDDATALEACDAPAGSIMVGGDCDDGDPTLVELSTWYVDADGDGLGDDATEAEWCGQPPGSTAVGGDCDDDDASVTGPTTWYFDDDGDGYGDDSTAELSCVPGPSREPIGGDCDDDDADAHPGGLEVCDGVDNDCDTLIDDDDDSVDTTIGGEAWYTDSDEDGYGLPEDEEWLCEDPGDGRVRNARDCDDGDPAVSPGSEEICGDGIDNDCDGTPGPCVMSGTIDLGDSDAKLVAGSTDELAGYSVSGAGDVDGDGLDDMLVAAVYNDTGGSDAGAVYLVRGPVTGTFDLGEADTTFVGEEAGDFAGWSVSGAGDVDGDGLDDMLVGAVGNDEGGSMAGAAYVLLGPATGGAIDLADAHAKIVGSQGGDFMGLSLSSAGDVDGDGLGDVLVGAPYGEDASAYLLLGPISGGTIKPLGAYSAFVGEASGDYAGAALAGAGDVDGDGFDDLLVGADCDDKGGIDAGAAYVVLGPTSRGAQFLSDAHAKIVGEESGDNAGNSVAGVGDVNGDGLDDVLIGAPDNEDGASGAEAYLVLGSAVGGLMDLADAHAMLAAEAIGDGAASSVSGAGDVDGNGHQDIIIGAPGSDARGSGSGVAYLVFGPVSGNIDLSDADSKLMGEAAGDHAGSSVSSAGDVDGNGTDDVIVGAYGDDDGGGSMAGAAYLMLGAEW